jgi:hypothetical protein
MKRYQVKSAGSKLDWSAAVPLTDFAFPWESTPAPFTEFRALHSPIDDRLHFRFECIDHDLVLGEGKTAKERVLGSDRVEIFFTPELRLDPYYCVEMAPSGDVYGYRAQTYRKFDDAFSWSGLMLETARAGERYTVVGSLPLQTLRDLRVLLPNGRELLAGLYRAEFSHRPDASVHQGWMSWVDPATEQPDFHVPSSFGVLELSI